MIGIIRALTAGLLSVSLARHALATSSLGEYRVAEGCPAREQFESQLERRLRLTGVASGELRIVVEQSDGTFVGHATLRRKTGEAFERIKDYAASASCMNQAGVCQTGCAQHPQVCVDWCDAYAYCAAVGKRLCGAIGGGSIAISDFANAAKSQWYRACSSGGVNSFPYGNTYDGKRCNGYDYWGAAAVRTTVPVGTLAGCQSTVAGYGGVYDLTGNMREWVDSCNSSVVGATCALRGGAFNDSGGLGSYLDCAAGDGAPPDMAVNAGFRCCADDT